MKCPKCKTSMYPKFDPVTQNLEAVKCGGCRAEWESGRVSRIYEDIRAHSVNQLHKIVDHLEFSDDSVEKVA